MTIINFSWKPSWTVDQAAANLVRTGLRWGASGAQTVSYSFFTSAPTSADGYGYVSTPEPTGFSPFNASQQAAARNALQYWSDAANIRFVETTGASGTIRFGNTTAIPGAQAWAYLPSSYIALGGDVWINPLQSSNFQLYNGGYGLLTLIHEIGHAIGLSHPGAYDASQGTPTYANDAIYAEDTRQYSVMSYWNASANGAYHGSRYAATPLLHDIAAAQSLYGVNTATRSGDTVYGFNSNAGSSPFDFASNPAPVVAIWDGGGVDTIDLSGYATDARLDLNDGAFSSVGGLTGNLAIAVGADIENAIGGSGNDEIFGNELANVLAGGAGGDTLWGGLGDDILNGGLGGDLAVFSGTQAAYSFNYLSGASFQFVGPDGSDTLIDVEYARFGTGAAMSIASFVPMVAASLSVDAASAAEANAGTRSLNFTVHLSAAISQTVTFSYATANGTAVAGRDYVAASGTGTIAAGATSTTVAIGVLGDRWVEGNETFSLVLSNPAGATLQGGVAQLSEQGRILDDDRLLRFGDLNGDGRADLLPRRTADGYLHYWSMNGTAITGGGGIMTLGSALDVAGVGDFNGDGRDDLMLRFDDGRLHQWTMNGSQIQGGGPVGNPGSGYSVAGVGDFNNDNRDDLLLRTSATGQLDVWLLNGNIATAKGALPFLGDSWQVGGVGDFDGNGNADILLRRDDGRLHLWTMSGTSITGGGVIADLGTSWQVGAVDDFNGDNRDDILLHHDDGRLHMWTMNGLNITGGGLVADLGTGWELPGTGDLNGDGRADLVLRRLSDGYHHQWTVNGPTITGGGPIASLGEAWTINGALAG